MNRVRHRIGDVRLNRLIRAFLKAGVMSEDRFLRTEAGTPQGGILSPLPANIALSVIDERYKRHAWPRMAPRRLDSKAKIERRARADRDQDKNRGRPVFVPVRYADDFIILICAPEGSNRMERAMAIAEEEKAALSQLLKETLNLELSESKTLVTPVTAPIRFLGYHFRVQRHPVWGLVSKITVPKERSRKRREGIKIVFKRPTCNQPLSRRIKKLNPIIRGWGYFYRHAWGAKDVFRDIDNHVWHTIYLWLRKKHPKRGMKQLAKWYGRRPPGRRSIKWHDENVSPFDLSSLRVERYHLWCQQPPDFVATPMESPVHSERRSVP